MRGGEKRRADLPSVPMQTWELEEPLPLPTPPRSPRWSAGPEAWRLTLPGPQARTRAAVGAGGEPGAALLGDTLRMGGSCAPHASQGAQLSPRVEAQLAGSAGVFHGARGQAAMEAGEGVPKA